MVDSFESPVPPSIPEADRTTVVLTHLAGLAVSAFCFVLAGAPAALIRSKSASPMLREEARKSFNFHVSMTVFFVALFFVIALLASFDLTPEPVLLLLGLAMLILSFGWIIEPIRAMLRTRKGMPSRYVQFFEFMK